MLTKRLLAYRANSDSKKNKAPRSSVNYETVVHIGVLFTIENKDKHECIKTLIKRFEEDGKSVEVLAYLPKNSENHEFLFDFFTAKDISLWGKFTSDTISNFSKNSFDYLFYIDQQSNLILRSILAMSKAKCRIAKSDVLNAPYSEMMVQVSEDSSIKKLIDEMYRYTKMLS